MPTRFNAALARIFGHVLAVLFAGLIIVVFLQVTARNILHVPMTWTLDLAQLLFAWCIFLGAAMAFRNDQHYVVDVWPKTGPLNFLPVILPILASGVVIFVLVRNGSLMSLIGTNRLSPALGISEVWFFLPIPLGGLCMALFLLEKVQRELRK